MNKPLIGIVIAVSKHDHDMVTVESKYMHAVENNGGIPILFPIYREGLIPQSKLIQMVDGVILTGSFILKDKIVNEKMVNAKTSLKEINPAYYEYSVKLIRSLRKNNKPLLGICRGMQIMAEEGGSKVRKISNPQEHRQESPPHKSTHIIKITPKTTLHGLVGNTLNVNSFHRQAVYTPAKKYITSAVSEEGYVEAIENKGKWFAIGTQFHPEWLFENDSKINKIFKHFLKKCKTKKH